MNKKRLICAFFALALLLAGCAAGERAAGEEATVTVYYLQAEGGPRGGPLLVGEAVSAGDEPLAAAVAALGREPGNPSLKSALPAHVPILSWTLTGGELLLSLGPGYLSLEGMDKTAADYALSLTLGALEGVETLSLAVAGRKVAAGLSAADAVLEDVVDRPGFRRLRLYFADAGGRYLVPEYRMIPEDADVPVERRVMEEFLRGPEGAYLRPAVPEGTRLLTVYRENRQCTVDLSGEFLENLPETALGERLAVYSLVSALCDISGVDAVRILVEGRAIDYCRYLPVSKPISANPGVLGPAIPARGEWDADVYMALSRAEGLTPVPEKLVPAEGASQAEALMEKLLNGMGREVFYLPLFPRQEGQQPKSPEPGFSLKLREGVCTVLLPAATVDWCNEQGVSRLSAQAIALTLLQLPEIRAVYVGCMDDTADLDGVPAQVPVWVGDGQIIR